MKAAMKIVNLLKENTYLVALIFLMLIISWKMPQTYWSFVDDGEMIEVSQRMHSSLNLLSDGQIPEWLKDPQAGRFRPMYWVFHYLVYVLFGLNRFGHGIMQVLILGTTSLMCYLTAKKIGNSKLAGFLAGTFFIANALSEENWYRLGPQEAPLIFFFSTATYFYLSYILVDIKVRDSEINLGKLNWENIKKNLKDLTSELLVLKKILRFDTIKEAIFVLFALIFTFLGYMTKENSIAFIAFPASLFAWFALTGEIKTRSVNPKVLWYLVFNVVLAVLVRYGAIRNYIPGSYASEYIFGFANIASNLNFYLSNIWSTFGPLLIVVFMYSLIKLRQFISSRKFPASASLYGIILVTFLSFFIIQLPWRYAVTRYLLPSFYFFSIFIGLVLGQIVNAINAKDNAFLRLTGLVNVKGILLWGIWFLIVTVVVYNLATMRLYVSRIYNLSNNFNRALIARLADDVGNNGRVILDTPPGTAIELKQEIGLHLRLFWDRPDVRVEYFENVGKLNSNDILLRAGELRQVSKESDFSSGTLENKKRIDIHIENKLYYPPMTFMKKYLPHLATTIFTTKIFSFNPVVASSADNYFWEIYDIN